MSKPWVLTRQAEAALREIADWTVQTFGLRQADSYAEDLIARCAEIARGEAPSQECRRLIAPDLPEELRFARAGQHFIVFINTPEQVVVVDFLHGRSDLPRRLANLTGFQS